MAKKIKVSEKTVQELRKGTMAGNLAKAKNASPEMKEALIRFYGLKRVSEAGGIKDSKRAQLGTLPKKSVAIKSKPKAAPSRTGIAPVSKKTVSQAKPGPSVAKRLDSAARNVYKYAGPENFIAGGVAAKAAIKVGKTVDKASKAATIAKNTKTLKTATGSKANLARTKIGQAKGLATKGEVKQAKAAVNKKRGMK